MTLHSPVLGEDSPPSPKRKQRRTWHFTPELPVKQAPYFERPFKVVDSSKYLFNIWRPLNQRFLLLLLAIAAWTWFTPSLERAREFRLDWMLEIGLRNLVIFNAMLHTVGGPTSHCGYHRVHFGRIFSLQLGDFMHQLHHRFCDCNYGSYETPWDKVFDSFHDGTEAGDAWMKERRKKLFNRKNELAEQ